MNETLSKYIPELAVKPVFELIVANQVHLKIVNERVTRHGDYRKGINGKHEITVNANLNKYKFLITLIHEISHLVAFENFGRNIKPHGEEWKMEFRRLLLPVIDHASTPENLKKALVRSLVNTKASSCSDHHLSRALMQFDKPVEGLHLLEHLPKNAIFALNSKQFKKGELRRKRFLCEDLNNGRSYLVNALAKVTIIKNE